MSLILEALKKSEAKRRLGAAPDLGTPFAERRRRSPIVPIVVVVLVAVALAWWAVRRPAPEAPVQKTVAQNATPPAPSPPVGQRAGAPLRSVTGDNNLQQTPPPENLKSATPNGAPDPFVARQSPSVNNDPAAREALKQMRDRRRANANRGDNAAPPAGIPQPLLPKPQRVTPPANTPTLAAAPPRPAPVAALPPTPVATPLQQQAAAVAATPPPAKSLPSAVATPAPKVADANTPAAPAATRALKTPGTVGLPVNPPAKPAPTTSAQPYSELPFSVRKALPELKLSMHVYAADPAQRFIVLNDSRIGEGDKTGDDVYVREIRPDGAVLEFQGQRFFYPRDGL